MFCLPFLAKFLFEKQSSCWFQFLTPRPHSVHSSRLLSHPFHTPHPHHGYWWPISCQTHGCPSSSRVTSEYYVTQMAKLSLMKCVLETLREPALCCFPSCLLSHFFFVTLAELFLLSPHLNKYALALFTICPLFRKSHLKQSLKNYLHGSHQTG